MNLGRFLSPTSIAVYGGLWASNVIEQLQKSGYQGEIWPVHPKKTELNGLKCFVDTESLPRAPDAAFIGVNRELTLTVVEQLQQQGAGGAICFASGFREADDDAQLEVEGEGDLQDKLAHLAGDMPMLGPNCYGYLNYLDNVCLWPDQHGGLTVDSGVAIIAQSSNVAINMTMQRRGLSLAGMYAVGNQASVGLNQIAEYLLNDPRVTAIGLFIEGFVDIPAFEKVAALAKSKKKNLVALKLGKSTEAQAATLSHTATLAGGAAASSALLKRLGIVEVSSISTFIETLKILQVVGPIAGNKIVSMSCSGGEASLMADSAKESVLEFSALQEHQMQKMRNALGSKVTLANPLDYHTYVWGDVPNMTATFRAALEGDADLAMLVLDVPRSDRCDPQPHQCAIDSLIAAKAEVTGESNTKVAMISSLPENLEEPVVDLLHSQGIVVLHGIEPGFDSVTAAVTAGRLIGLPDPEPVLVSQPRSDAQVKLLSEDKAKRDLADFGLLVPAQYSAQGKEELLQFADTVTYPVVVKGLGLAHKSESGAVILGIQDKAQLEQAIERLPDCEAGYLLEQMIDQAIAELIVGVTRDATGLLMLTIGAGGVLTELIADSTSLLLPVSREAIIESLSDLKVAALLNGYRGKPSADIDKLVQAIMAIQSYVLANAEQIIEIDINPLIVRKNDAIAVDALIRMYE